MIGQPERRASPTHPQLRWALIASALLVCALVAWSTLGRHPRLSPVERDLVGVWGHPQIETPVDFGLPVWPMRDPWYVMELGPDRTFRTWFASADDLSEGYRHVDGRWRVVDGRLLIEDIPRGARRSARDLKLELSRRTDLIPTPHRIHVPSLLDFRFEGPDGLVTTLRGTPRNYERLLPRPTRSPNPPSRRTRPATPIPGPSKVTLDGPDR